MFSLISTAQIKISKHCNIWGYVTHTGEGEGESLIKVGTDGGIRFFRGRFYPDIRFSWEVLNFARAFLTSSDKKCVKFLKRVNKK